MCDVRTYLGRKSLFSYICRHILSLEMQIEKPMLMILVPYTRKCISRTNFDAYEIFIRNILAVISAAVIAIKFCPQVKRGALSND